MTFELCHITGDKDEFKGITDAPLDGMYIQKLKPSLPLLLKLIKHVGEDSQWDKRQEFNDPDMLRNLKERISDAGASLYLFKRHGTTVGFCQILDNTDLSKKFNQSSSDEIYKIGLFPNHRGKGLGAFYTSSILAEIFKEKESVYLNTRDTNVVNSVPFYERLGLHLVKEEEIENDGLITDPKPSDSMG